MSDLITLNELELIDGDVITQEVIGKIDSNTTAIQTAINSNSNKIGDLNGSGLTETDLATAIKNDRSSLSDIEQQNNDVVHLISFPRIGAEADDTGRLQRAIDSFTGNFAGTILIAETIHVSNKITCNKTGLILQGVSNKKSKIISSYAGVTLEIKPLYNGSPYTNTGYCKFFANDIAIQAEGDAITSGTGLWLQWIYASSFINLFTSGFSKHIVLKGSHLNTFYNLFQQNSDNTEQEIELHTRGVGLSADSILDVAGETTSNNNHIIGGWMSGTSWDLTGLNGTVVEKIDIEPASNSFICGNGTIFKDCRFERMDYDAVHGLYASFPWFVLGNNNKFYNNVIAQSGASENGDLPIYQINGDFNEIEIDNNVPYNQGLVSFGDAAKGNIITYKAQFMDYQNTGLDVNYKVERESIRYNNKQNRIVFIDNLQGTITDIVGSNTKAQGEFTCVCSKNVVLKQGANYDWDYQGCVSSDVDIPLPIGRAVGSTSFVKVTLNTSNGNRRMLLNTPIVQTATVAGIYAMTATVYIPSTSSIGILIGATLNTLTPIKARNKWVTIRSRAYFNVGDVIQPTLSMIGISGDIFYVGEISVCAGNTAVYIPNATTSAVTASF